MLKFSRLMPRINISTHQVCLAWAIAGGSPWGVNKSTVKFCQVVCKSATPRGSLASLDDLSNHDCLVIKERSTPFGIWHLSDDSQEHSVKIQAPLSSNSGEIVLQWALDGRGIVLRSKWDVQKYLESGELIQVLPQYTQSANIWAVYPTRLSHSAKLRVCVEALQAYLQDQA